MSYKLTRDDFLKRLQEKITLLQVLCKSYDRENKYSLAKDMAVAVRVIVYDRGDNSISLLTHLGIKEELEMLTTMKRAEPNQLFLLGEGLYITQIENGLNGAHCRYLPKFNNEVGKNVNFAEWWNEMVLHDMAENYQSDIWYTRKDLITSYSNKEGGAHVEGKLSDTVMRQSSDKISGFAFCACDGTGRVVNQKTDNTPKDATVRQIVYELLCSIYKKYPDLFDEKYF